MKIIAAILLLLASGTAIAQTPSHATNREIVQLFAALESSKCEFYRNGSWHNAQRASAHLHQKYSYLLKKGLVTSTESFIDLAASKSSMSGKPYLVRCGAAQPITSKLWFTNRLKELRGRPAGANNSFKPKPLRGSA
jgi:hypothetical protein